jgi:hypothetical protein
MALEDVSPELVQHLAQLSRQYDVQRPQALCARQALESCRASQRLEERGYLDELRARHTYMKRYLPAIDARCAGYGTSSPPSFPDFRDGCSAIWTACAGAGT